MIRRVESFMLNNFLALRFRDAIGCIIAPVMTVTGFRFSKDYRHGIDLPHRLTYMFCDTIHANRMAGMLWCKFNKNKE